MERIPWNRYFVDVQGTIVMLCLCRLNLSNESAQKEISSKLAVERAQTRTMEMRVKSLQSALEQKVSFTFSFKPLVWVCLIHQVYTLNKAHLKVACQHPNYA